MLEGLVATLLNRFLGMYVQNFDPKQLNIGIWSGDVKLRNLELRREALAGIDAQELGTAVKVLSQMLAALENLDLSDSPARPRTGSGED